MSSRLLKMASLGAPVAVMADYLGRSTRHFTGGA